MCILLSVSAACMGELVAIPILRQGTRSLGAPLVTAQSAVDTKLPSSEYYGTSYIRRQDSSYFAAVTIAKQTLNLILDTGSFYVNVVLETTCAELPERVSRSGSRTQAQGPGQGLREEYFLPNGTVQAYTWNDVMEMGGFSPVGGSEFVLFSKFPHNFFTPLIAGVMGLNAMLTFGTSTSTFWQSFLISKKKLGYLVLTRNNSRGSVVHKSPDIERSVALQPYLLSSW
ncbi:hypothetical protein C8F01DRAFT_1091242 [Mycena amicta]|nr:hypothetical protein C8F01DRAFT_1091242 [Mycena amicta]